MHGSSCEIALFQYRFGEGHAATRTVRRRSRLFALVTARRLLAPLAVVTTNACYHRDVARGAFAEIACPGRRSERVDAPVVVVPSVGERGVW